MRIEQLDTELRFAAEHAWQMGDVMKEHFFSPELYRRSKSDLTDVTAADLEISSQTVDAYKARHRRVVSEEEGSSGQYGDRNADYVDPIDGTSDFIEGRSREPRTSIAMYSWGRVVEGHFTMGVALAPLLRAPRLYVAAEGLGSLCFVGNRPMAVQGRELAVDPEPTSGIVLVSPRPHPYIDNLRRAGFTTIGMDGSVFKGCAIADPKLLPAFYAQLDAERNPIVGYVSNTAWAHDYAGAAVVAGLAGAMVSAPDGGPLSREKGNNGCVFANNPNTHNRILEILNAGSQPVAAV